MRYTGRGRDDLKKKITNQILKGNLLIVWLLERIFFYQEESVNLYPRGDPGGREVSHRLCSSACCSVYVRFMIDCPF